MDELRHVALMGGIVTSHKDANTDYNCAALVRDSAGGPCCIDLLEGDDSAWGPRKFELVVSADVRAVQNNINAIVTVDQDTSGYGVVDLNSTVAIAFDNTSLVWPADAVAQARLRYDTDGAGTMSAWYQVNACHPLDYVLLLVTNPNETLADRDFQLDHLDTSLFNIETATAGRNIIKANKPYPIVASPEARYLHIGGATANIYLSKVA